MKGFFVTACIAIQAALAIRITKEPEGTPTPIEQEEITLAIEAALEAINEEISNL